MVKESPFLVHSTGQFGNPGSAVPVLIRPHALQMEKSHPVAVLKKAIKVRLQVGHGTEIPANKGNASFLSWQFQAIEEISHQAADWQL